MDQIIFLVGGGIAGMLVAWFIAKAKQAELTERVRSLQEQLDLRKTENSDLRTELEQAQHSRIQAETRAEENEKHFKEQVALLDEARTKLSDAFNSVAANALAKANEEMVKLAKERLGNERDLTVKDVKAEKGLIDQALKAVGSELEKVSTVVKALEKDRESKFSELATQIESANQNTADLRDTANSLREVLSSTQKRGQWGERMAEDILRMAGFVENINYFKQKAVDDSSDKPDFTFVLPKEMKMNMDVKFPLSNYTRYTEAEGAADKERYKAEFLRDVKSRVKEITTRDYINPKQNTVDYVLLFIPNEQIYAFINEHDASIPDEALKHKVVFCSPLTLFAVLAVIRQAIDNFALEKTSNQILMLLSAFKKQWEAFVKKMDTLGARLDASQKAFLELSSTRRNQLERPLNKIEELRQLKHIAEPDAGDLLQPVQEAVERES